MLIGVVFRCVGCVGCLLRIAQSSSVAVVLGSCRPVYSGNSGIGQIQNFLWRPPPSFLLFMALRPCSHRAVPNPEEIARHQWIEIVQRNQPNSIAANALAFPEFLDSTSTWNQRHIIAFRMLGFNDLPLSSIYPQHFYPQDDDKIISEIVRLFAVSKDDVRKGGFNMIQTGAAFPFYRTLQECLRTEQKTPSPPQVSIRPHRVIQPTTSAHQHTVSDSSGSSFIPSTPSMNAIVGSPVSEDKTETVTNILLANYLYLLVELESSLDQPWKFMIR